MLPGEVVLTPTGPFQRYSLAGFIDVQSIAPEYVDFVSPSRIVDLKVIEASYEQSRITQEWTAVGDDQDEGNGTSTLAFK